MTSVLFIQHYEDGGASSRRLDDVTMVNALTLVLELLTRRPDIHVTEVHLQEINE